MNAQKSGWGRMAPRVCIGIVGLWILLVFRSSFAQQIPFQPSGPGVLPAATQGEPIPGGTSPQVPPEDYKNDPLFQEIQRIILKGDIAPNSSVEPKMSVLNLESISDARWHAVESILAAARMLESDVANCIQRSDVEGATKLQLAIKNLRMQAVDLLPKF